MTEQIIRFAETRGMSEAPPSRIYPVMRQFAARSSCAACSGASHSFCSRQAHCPAGQRMRRTTAHSRTSRKTEATGLSQIAAFGPFHLGVSNPGCNQRLARACVHPWSGRNDQPARLAQHPPLAGWMRTPIKASTRTFPWNHARTSDSAMEQTHPISVCSVQPLCSTTINFLYGNHCNASARRAAIASKNLLRRPRLVCRNVEPGDLSKIGSSQGFRTGQSIPFPSQCPARPAFSTSASAGQTGTRHRRTHF